MLKTRLRATCVFVCLASLWPGALAAQSAAQIVMAPTGGTSPAVRVMDGVNDRVVLPYDAAFTGGVRVAVGDVNGDQIYDVITGPGPGGGPHVRVLSGSDFSEIASFFAFDPAFFGGVNVAAGDVDGDGKADIIAGAGAGGGPHVRVFSGADLTELASFYAYTPAFAGGVTVAAGDVDGDGKADIITGAGPGGGPHVRVFKGTDISELASFHAYISDFYGGVTVAAGDADGDGKADIITGAGAGGGPHVRVFSGADLTELASFYAYDATFYGGVSVGAVDLNADGRIEILTGAGPGGGPHVQVWNATDLTVAASFYAFDPAYGGGVQVATVYSPPLLRFTSDDETTFTAGAAGTFEVTTEGGGPSPVLTVTGTLPAGVTFTDNGDGTGTLAGTPSAGTGGTHQITFTVTRGTLDADQTFTLTVDEAPAITSGPSTTFVIGAAGTFSVTTTGFPTPQLTATGTLPAGVAFIDNGDGTGTLAGTPQTGSGGSYPIALTATNGVDPVAKQSFTLQINQTLMITSANATNFVVGAVGSFTVTATGVPTPALALTSGALPSGVTFLDNGNGTGTLTGTPAGGTAGTYPLTFTATNGAETPVNQSFTLTVRQAPAITSASVTTFTVGAAGSFTVITTGAPAPALTVGGVALPTGLTFVDNGDGTGTLSGTPAAATGGVYPITFTAANGFGSNDVQNFTLTVEQAPAFTSATNTTFAVAAAGSFTVQTSGYPPISSIVIGGAALPAGVTFTDNTDGTGTLSGAPAAGTGGAYAVTFTINNGVGGNVVQPFALTVNEAPSFTSAASTTFTAGSANGFSVTTAGQPSVTSIVLGGAALPTGVTFVDNGNGTATLSGNPASTDGGTYALTFTIDNGIGGNVVQNFTLNVNAPPTFTSAASTTFTAGSAATPFTVTTDGFPAITTITRGGVALPSGVSFVDNGDGTGTLSGTAPLGTGGSYAITFTINNGVGGNIVQNFTLNVNEPPAITSATSDSFVVGTADTFTITVTGHPAPTVAHTSGTLPAGVTFTSGTRVLAGTAAQTGAFPLQFTAANGVGTDAVQNFTLNVVCPAITVTPATMADGLYQTAYAGVDFNQTGSTGSSFTWGATGLPAGLTIDVNTGVVSGTPTDTVANGAVVVTVTDDFGCQGTRNTTITVRPTTDNENYTGGVGNTQVAVGVAGIATPHVAFADNVKTGDNGPGALSVVFNAPANGAVLEGSTDGTFVYSPNAGFSGSSDTFTYTLTDGNGVTNTGSVTVNLSGMVWYVNSASAGGDGRSHAPFNSLDDAATPSGAGSFVYVHSGAGTTTGNLAMDANQTLQGQGAVFTFGGLTILNGTRPTLTGTVTLANNDSVRGLNFTPSGIPAMTATALTQPVGIDQVDVTGGTSALSLTSVSGTVTVTNANFTNTSGAEVLINQGTGTVNIAAVINSNAGRSVDVQNRTAGTVTFSGAITDTGTGILLNNNDGSTVTFSGGLTLTTGTNVAFRHANGGASIVSGSNNTITTTGAAAIELIGTSLEHQSGTHTWRSITAANAAKGISVQWHDSPFTVTGTDGGDAGSLADAGTGGTISSMTNRGAEFVRVTGAVSLGGMNFINTGTTNGTTSTACGSPQTGQPQNCAAAIHLEHTSGGVTLSTIAANSGGQIGINGTNVTNLVMTNIEVTNFGNEVDEHGVQLHNLFGTGSLTNGNVHDNEGRQFYISNGSGLLTSFAIANSTFDGNTVSPNGLQGVQLETFNAGTSATVTVSGSVISDNFNTGWQAQANSGSTLTANISGTDLTNNNAAVIIQASSGGTLNTVIENNDTATGPLSGSGAISVKTDGGSTMAASIRNNRIGNSAVGSGASCGGCNGIFINPREGGFMDLEIIGNIIEHVPQRAISVDAGQQHLGSGQWGKADIVITGNLIRNPDNAVNSLQAISLTAGIGEAGEASCLAATVGGTVNPGAWPSTAAGAMNRIEGNWFPTPGGTGNELRLRRRTGNTFHIPGLSGDPVAWLAVRNSITSADGVNIAVIVDGGGSFTSGLTCQ